MLCKSLEPLGLRNNIEYGFGLWWSVLRHHGKINHIDVMNVFIRKTLEEVDNSNES